MSEGNRGYRAPILRGHGTTCTTQPLHITHYHHTQSHTQSQWAHTRTRNDIAHHQYWYIITKCRYEFMGLWLHALHITYHISTYTQYTSHHITSHAIAIAHHITRNRYRIRNRYRNVVSQSHTQCQSLSHHSLVHTHHSLTHITHTHAIAYTSHTHHHWIHHIIITHT